ncbi:MAG: hypothetical protein ABR953_11235 [Candidatus Acidiferrales bacterium]|jgi:hypothetical protein
MYPASYLYSTDHGWIEVAGTTATVGITDYAQQELGDIVFVESSKLGAQVQAGQSFGTIESVKAVEPRRRRRNRDQPGSVGCSGTDKPRSARLRLAREGPFDRPEENRRLDGLRLV